MKLVDLPYDVFMEFLFVVFPADLAALAQTSQPLNAFIKGNKLLWKTQYLQNLDDPRVKPTDPQPEWEAELQQVVKVLKIMASDDAKLKRENYTLVSSTIMSLLDSSAERDRVSRNIVLIASTFENSQNVDAVLHRSSLFRYAGTVAQQPADDEEERQLSAKLHCYHGMASVPHGPCSESVHPYARSRVYDLRNYTGETRWGPFRDDGSMRVDWEMVESIMIDIAYKSDHSCPRFKSTFTPVWSEPFEGVVKDRGRSIDPPSMLMEPDIPLELRDPYNITGTWHRIVCFLHYEDLYSFNFRGPHPQPDQPRPPIEAAEAIRHIIMRLKIVRFEQSDRFDDHVLPVARFTGVSRSTDLSGDPNANSTIRGRVSLTPEGEVRWTTISIFDDGEERWRSEGIQVGGLNSKRGVVGTWFDKDFDDHGPAGPTVFWKVRDKSNGLGMEDDESEEDSDADSDYSGYSGYSDYSDYSGV